MPATDRKNGPYQAHAESGCSRAVTGHLSRPRSIFEVGGTRHLRGPRARDAPWRRSANHGEATPPIGRPEPSQALTGVGIRPATTRGSMTVRGFSSGQRCRAHFCSRSAFSSTHGSAAPWWARHVPANDSMKGRDTGSPDIARPPNTSRASSRSQPPAAPTLFRHGPVAQLGTGSGQGASVRSCSATKQRSRCVSSRRRRWKRPSCSRAALRKMKHDDLKGLDVKGKMVLHVDRRGPWPVLRRAAAETRRALGTLHPGKRGVRCGDAPSSRASCRRWPSQESSTPTRTSASRWP